MDCGLSCESFLLQQPRAEGVHYVSTLGRVFVDLRLRHTKSSMSQTVESLCPEFVSDICICPDMLSYTAIRPHLDAGMSSERVERYVSVSRLQNVAHVLSLLPPPGS